MPSAGPDVPALLAQLPGVAAAAASARAAVDDLLWDRTLRANAAAVAAQALLQSARADAALEGADLGLAAFASGAAFDDSPIGRVAAASLRLHHGLRGLTATVDHAPSQALAALHRLAAGGLDTDARVGRPRNDDVADDPLRIGGALPGPAEVAARLDALTGVLRRPTTAPALVVAGLVHGELLALRPFGWGSGLVARAAARLVLSARGVDPDLLLVPEEGVLAAGRPAYVAAIRGYATGAPDGVASWLVLTCRTVAAGAAQTRTLLAQLA
ncbi:MAG: oxidoreductase [Actinomycetota bacterium]|nr:MAG: oxidoreductase [Actinomycetota bacterium]